MIAEYMFDQFLLSRCLKNHYEQGYDILKELRQYKNDSTQLSYMACQKCGNFKSRKIFDWADSFL